MGMDLSAYWHHPDICLPLVKRRATESFLDFLAWYSRAGTVRWWTYLWAAPCYPSRRAYQRALGRLRKKGLVVTRKPGAELPLIELLPAAEEHMPPCFRPEREWGRRWAGFWYLLSYDVPETSRGYRDALRRFLKRHKLGCLHKSVYITPRDIRPEYDDLTRAAGLKCVSFLMEARTVLGMTGQEIALEAWDFDRLEQIHYWYGQAYKDWMEMLQGRSLSRDELIQLAREEILAYQTAMEEDPLLPRELWPPTYGGERVYELHKVFVHNMTRCLKKSAEPGGKGS